MESKDNSKDNKYSTLKLSELQQMCRDRKARVSGRKQELVKRLMDYDRNDNFGNLSQLVTPKWTMQTPPVEIYRDFTEKTTIPKISKKTLTAYLPEGEEISKNAKDMYHNRYLRYVRLAKPPGSDSAYIRGLCSAQMKKSVSYFVDIELDSAGIICTTQCECAAGVGPEAHCKHVQIVALALVDHSERKEICLNVSCTSKPQSFHKPKKIYKGSPVKAETFPTPRGMKDLLFDPEPMCFKETPEAYQARILNETVNFVSSTGYQIPLLQLVPPANVFASSHDHDYCSLPGATPRNVPIESDEPNPAWTDFRKNCTQPELDFLAKFNVEQIDEKTVTEIELKTRHQTKTKSSFKRWKAERMKRLQSSNYGRICKSYKDGSKANKSKIAQDLLNFQDIKCAALAHGRKYEDVAINKFEKEYGICVKPSGIVVDLDKPFLACSPDGIIDDNTVIEVKCPYAARDKPINPVTVPYLRETADGLSLSREHDYMYQVQAQMAICKKNTCKFVVYTFKDFKCISIAKDEPFIRQMNENLTKFYTEHFRPALLAKNFYKNTDKYCWD